MNQHLKILLLFFCFALPLLTASCKKEKAATEASDAPKQTYICPMHPQVVSEDPKATCPICGMDLVPFDKSSQSKDLTLSESQIALAHVTVDTVRNGDFSAYKTLNGRLATDPSQTEFISTRVAGRIEKLFVKETGVIVAKGQPLYQIYSEALAALQQEYILATAQLTQFPDDATFRQLAAGARQKLLLYGQSEAQLKQLTQTKKVYPLTTFSAPASGVISELLAVEGQYLPEGGAIMRLEGYGELWVSADVYPAEARHIKTGTQVQVRIPGYNKDGLTTTIQFIEPALQAGTQLMTIRGAISNPGRQLRPGMQATLLLPVAQHSEAISLPTEAVIEDGRGAHVWVQTDVGKFEPRKVTTGAATFDRIEITKGLKVGDIVVVTGAYLLSSEFILKKGTHPLEK